MFVHRLRRLSVIEVSIFRVLTQGKGIEVSFGKRSRDLHLQGLHLVEDGLGELVGGGIAAHVAGAGLAVRVLAGGLSGTKAWQTYPSAMTP